jgi:hypothetical protein
VDYGRQVAVCPQCGSSAEVRTVGELFDMMNGMQDQAMQRAQGMQQGPYPGQGGPGGYTGPVGAGGQGEVYAGGYSESTAPGGGTPYRNRPSYDNDSFTGDIGQDIAGAVLGGATRFLGRAIGKKIQKTFEERVVPAMQAKAAQQQQQWQDSRADQAAIIAKYPDLRGCTKDQVVFFEGGSRVVPLSEIKMPVTMASADAVASKLR